MNSNHSTPNSKHAHEHQHVSGEFHMARQEDLRLIQGKGHFTADTHYEGQLHMHVIRSVHGHAKIKRLNLEAVKSAPGVVCVLTADDLAAHGGVELPHPVSLTSPQGVAQHVNKMPLLAKDRVRFVGQPIAFVVANSAFEAQNASELADIDFEELQAVASVHDAIQPGAPLLHDNAPGNVSVDFESGDRAKVEAAFANAAHVSTVQVNSQRLIGFPMEPRAVVAVYDAKTGRTRVHTPSQGLNNMLGFLTQASGYKVEELEIVTQDVGGSFGLRTAAYPEHVGVMVASKLTGKPVKWVATRSETILSDWHGRGLSLQGSIALDLEGRILAIRFEDWVDSGAFNAYMSSFIGSRNLSITMGGVYQVPALYMHSTFVYTNTVPISAYRGAGRPDIAYGIERLIDFACHEHGFDPVQLRKKNFIPTERFPYTTANGYVYDYCDFEQVLDQALELADYKGFKVRKEASKAKGLLRGIGISTYVEASGAGTAQKDQVLGEINAQGQLVISGVTGPSGQGHETSFAKIVENELGLESEHVKYQAGLAGMPLIGNGTGGSRSLYGAGSAIKNLCALLKGKLSKILSSHWGVPLESVHLSDEAQWMCAQPLGSAATGAWAQPTLSTHQVLKALSEEQRTALRVVGEAQSGSTFPNGCHVAELEIDPQTGVTEIVGYVSVDELGVVISPELVKGQVHGGVVQGLGQAFYEQAVYDSQAQLLTGSLMDYALPRADALKDLTHGTVELQTQLNLLGAKGVGESGCTGSLPAVANAMMDALRPFGVNALDMPFTSAKVWEAIQRGAQSQTVLW
jgi:carbon-monoxide dehydrogenase large subunit